MVSASLRRAMGEMAVRDDKGDLTSWKRGL